MKKWQVTELIFFVEVEDGRKYTIKALTAYPGDRIELSLYKDGTWKGYIGFDEIPLEVYKREENK